MAKEILCGFGVDVDAVAGWLGMRYAELLPIPLAAKQKLLEIEDSLDRLEIIYRFLESKGLLPEA